MWYKRTVPLLIVFVIGILAFAQNFIPHPWSSSFLKELTSWTIIIGGFALFLGAYSLLHMHVTRIRRQQPGWAYSGFVFIGAATMIILGLWNDGVGPLEERSAGVGTWFQWHYDYILVPCSATIFSILAFFMASAAFRTFRARNVGAALLLIAAIIVMFGQAPVNETVGAWFGAPKVFSKTADIIMDYPNAAAIRGIVLGVSLGAIAQSLRILFGIERAYMGGGD